MLSKGTYSQVSGIRAWTSIDFGQGVITLPTVTLDTDYFIQFISKLALSKQNTTDRGA